MRRYAGSEMGEPLVQIRVEFIHGDRVSGQVGRFYTVLRVGGVEFWRPAADETEAGRVAMEVQGTFESRLKVQFI